MSAMRKVASMLVVLGFLGVARARSLETTYDQRQEGKVNVQIDVKDVQILALVDSEMLEDYTNYDYAYDYADFTIKPRPTTGKPSSTQSSDGSSTPSSSAEEAGSTWPTNSPSSTPASSDEASPTKAPDADQPNSSPSSVTQSDDETAAATVTVAVVQHTEEDKENESKKIVEGVSNATKIEAEKQQQIQELSISSTTVAATTAAAAETVSTVSNAADETKPNPAKRPVGHPEPRKRCPVGFLLKSGKCFKRRYSLISPRLALMKLAPALLSKNILSGIPAAASS